MNLNELLSPWLTQVSYDVEVTELSNDSRLIAAGSLFIAYPGAVTDGRLFIEKAVKAGASAIVYEPANFPANVLFPESIPCLPIANLAEEIGAIAQRFYQHSSRHLSVTGITGTNGKTTIAYQLAQAHELLGEEAAYIGTIGQGKVSKLESLANTTPDALCLHRLFNAYWQRGVRQVCMEVSSHALSQNRVEGIEFKQGIFTNLTLDHLDYHRTMDEYAQAKAKLFALEHLEWAIINQDDKYKGLMEKALQPHVKKITYGMSKASDVRVEQWQSDMRGTVMTIASPWGRHEIKIRALGQFNLYNSLAVFTSLMVHNYSITRVIEIMAELKAAPGRMEIVAQNPYVLVDFAHTPDALENVLRTLKEIKRGDLWVIFGCGGDRDKSKRPIMGNAAGLYADKVIVTSDNPRNEDPVQIIQEIVEGISVDKPQVTRVNRKEAIEYALTNAEAEDIILIAGKGHEAYQQIGAVKHPFSDQEIVKAIIG